MKAVIMAGGEGSRLRPITCDLPKPMALMLGKPVMEYAVDLLKKHGIKDVAVTLHYLPDSIKGYFGDGAEWGMAIRYFVEETPLGTAGSVRAARDFLNETFIVISGDALTDIDLSAAILFHKEKQADVTIVLKNVDAPVDYGVVIAAGDGRIERFIEKPSWSDVFSDTVNTGIYIIEPQVMDRIEPNAKADFSKDLFPALMASGARLYGFLSEGYWCDIGNPQQYREAQFDILSGKVKADCGLPQREPGIFVDASAEVSPDARLMAPCAVLYGALLNPGSVIGPNAVIGRNSIVETGASVEHSVLLDNVLVGKASHIENAVVCDDAAVEERVRINEGAVIGANVRIGSDSVISRNVSIWPSIRIERHSKVTQTQQRVSRYSQSIFDENGISGTFNDDITPENVARLAMALGSSLHKGNRVGIATWGDNTAVLLREAFDAGLLSTGVCCVDIDQLTIPAVRFAAKRLRLDGAVHIHAVEGRVNITFMDCKGANIDSLLERKIEDVLAKGAFRRARNEDIADIIDITGIALFYEQELFGGVGSGSRDKTIGLYGPDDALNKQAEKLLETMGYLCKRCLVDSSLEAASKQAVADGVKIGLYQHMAGNEFVFIDELGGSYRGDRLAVMLAMVAVDRGIPSGTVPLPVMASMDFDAFAASKGVAVERTPAARSEWLRRACYSTDERMCYLFFDGVYAAMCLVETLAMDGSLSSYAARIPETFSRQGYVDCPLDKRGLAMKTLYQKYGSSEEYGGALLNHEQGRVYITPDKQSSRFSVYSQSYREEFAEELAARYRDIISEIATNKEG